ncbi:MAG TPA: ABC transporter ATP-binding protein [Planctomycetaceae bacterium]|nr:ABC transporter ATP-binding protein [Planctomycetaceae bacterium]
MITRPADSSNNASIVCDDVHHRYGDREALRGVNLSIRPGEIFALLGPNGSGKTTLFRLLCTLVPIQRGRIEVAGLNVASNTLDVRGRIGIVFQSPSLDKKLTVDENIACQAALYGLSGAALTARRDEVLRQMKLTDRRGDFCEKLSGGLKRRVELAKGMLHQPTVMLLDEPSTGLDPSARLDLWQSLRAMADQGITVVLTTHLLEEADKADRVAIMFEGQVIADGTPQSLRAEMGDGLITIESADLDAVEKILHDEMGLETQRASNQVRIRCAGAPAWVPKIADRLGDSVHSISVGRPGLEDVFIAKTGYHFD